mgnify:CR=1 FL=1
MIKMNGKQEETAASQEKETMKDATGIIEGNGKAAYQNIREIKSTVGAGRIHLKTQPDTDEITVESKDTHKTWLPCIRKGWNSISDIE